MGDIDNNNKIVCNHEVMLECYLKLCSIVNDLYINYYDAIKLRPDFDAEYEGEAKEEVDIFLDNLPKHILKLALFYKKMAQFIQITSESLLIDDEKMVENMESNVHG